MAIRLNPDSITEIVAKCTSKKPYRAAVVAKTVQIKKVIDELKVAFSANEISVLFLNIAVGTYLVKTQNGSVIEIIDNSVYKQDRHIFHDAVVEGNGLRIIERGGREY